jgi:DNA-directed RNA polymerase subunit RPC12/RpoP
VTEATCQSCGEPVDSRQLVCLNCGARVALKEPTPWAREPVTAVAAVLVAVIVIGAGLFGFAIAELTSDDGGGAGTQAAATTTTSKPARQAPAVVSGGEQPARTAEEPQPSRGSDPLEGSAPRADRVPGWPAGLSAHTVVLVSSGDRAAALNVAKQARASGLEAGLIRSDPYNLGTGLWIVFSGQFTTPEGATRQAAQLADRYPGAYPQRIQKSQ